MMKLISVLAFVLAASSQVRAAEFTQAMGVGTHIPFVWSSYNDFAQVKQKLAYLGVKNVRDAYHTPHRAKYQELHQDLGVRFSFFITGLSGTTYQDQRDGIIGLGPSVVRYVEGVIEPDNYGAQYNTLTGMTAAVAIQKDLYPQFKSRMPTVPVIQMSLGRLATFDMLGDLSAFADYGNTHIYFGTGNHPGTSQIQNVINKALVLTPGKPIITTETGYYTTTNTDNPTGVPQSVQAKYMLSNIFDQLQKGVRVIYQYELVDQEPDPQNTDSLLHYGLFNHDWTPKPAALAFKNILSIMRGADDAVSATALAYTLESMPTTGNKMLFRTSDGYALVIWNDVRLSGPTTNAAISVPNVPITLRLQSVAGRADVYDPMLSATARQSYSNVSTLNLSLPDHPIVVKISTAAPPTPTPTPAPPSSTSSLSGKKISMTLAAGLISAATDTKSVTITKTGTTISTTFTFIDVTNKDAPKNGDEVYFKTEKGTYLTVASDGKVNASSTTPYYFRMRKASGSAGLQIVNGDKVFFAAKNGLVCGPSVNGAVTEYRCTSTWVNSAQFVELRSR